MAVDRGRQKDVQTRRIVPTTGDPASSSGLVASPVVLAVVSLAVVPWVAFAARTDVAGRLVSRAVSVAAWVAAGLILALNAALVVSVVRG